jgi:mRNA-degrading endonuclease RelE of RelBE toxin-antitoxin system
MPAAWKIAVKPCFLSELLCVPTSAARQVQRKVDELRADPRPDGNHKKKLVNSKEPLYRIRAGKYRLFYTFGNEWVWLLALRKHDGYDDVIKPDPTPDASAREPASPHEEELTTFEVELPPAPTPDGHAPVIPPPAPAVPQPLPAPLTLELLVQLRVPPEYRHALVECADEEALIRALEKVPHPYGPIVMDALFPPPLDKVHEQPDLVVTDTESLIDFNAGIKEIKDFQPSPGNPGPSPTDRPVAIPVNVPDRSQDIVKSSRSPITKKIVIAALALVSVLVIVLAYSLWPKKPPPPPTNQQETQKEKIVRPEEARDWIGKECTVEMTVRSTHDLGWAVALNSEKDFREPRNLAILIEKETAGKELEQKGVDNLERYFKAGTVIRVTGTVEEHLDPRTNKTSRQIKVKSANRIEKR